MPEPGAWNSARVSHVGNTTTSQAVYLQEAGTENIFTLKINLFNRKAELQSDGETEKSSTHWFTSQMAQQLGQDKTKTRNQKVHLGLPKGWLGPK